MTPKAKAALEAARELIDVECESDYADRVLRQISEALAEFTSKEELDRARVIAAWAAKQIPPGIVADTLTDPANPYHSELVAAIAAIIRRFEHLKDHG